MKAQMNSRIELYSFFNLGGRWRGWSTSCPGCFTLGKPGPHYIGGWVIPKALFIGMENLATPGLDRQTTQPIVSCCTNYAITVHITKQVGNHNLHLFLQ
jgi:hypothetical protein